VEASPELGVSKLANLDLGAGGILTYPVLFRDTEKSDAGVPEVARSWRSLRLV
jgi:hypothetical protein